MAISSSIPLRPIYESILSQRMRDKGNPFKLVQGSNLVLYRNPLRLVIVTSAGRADLGGCEIELGLAQLHNRAQTEIVAALGQIERKLRLPQQLIGHVDSVMCSHGGEVRDSKVPNDTICEIVDVLRGRPRSQFGFSLASFKQAAIENRYI